MPHLQHGNDPKRQTCPDSAALSAFMENQLGGSDRDAIAAHLAQCSECAELHDRLVSFSRATAAVQDPEWENAEKRLAIWMTGFLDTHLSAGRLADRTTAENSAKRWNWWHSWRFRWALSTVAALALTGTAFLLKPTLPWQVAVRAPAVSNTSSTAQTTTGTAPEKTSAAAAASKSPVVTAETHPARHGYISRTYAYDARGQRIALEGGGKQPEQAANSNAMPSLATEPRHAQTVIAQAETGPSATAQMQAPAPTPPPAPGNFAALPAGSAIPHKTPSMEPVTEPVAGAQSPSVTAQGSSPAAPGGTMARAAPVHPLSPSAGTATYRPAPTHPAVYQIAADTRLWIKLNTVNHQPDGSFTFQGSLLESVTEPGGAPLGRGTEIIGSGIVHQGKTSLVVAQIVVGGDRYSLKAASGEPNTQGPGAGPAVEFEAGKILEMFVASPSIYEKEITGRRMAAPAAPSPHR